MAIMKKLFIITLTLAAVFSLIACSKKTPAIETLGDDSGVFYNVAGTVIRIAYTHTKDKFLRKFDSHSEYRVGNGNEKFILSADTALRNFEFFKGHVDLERDGFPFIIDAVLYSINVLQPEKPFIVRDVHVPENFPQYGISFTASNNEKRYFTIRWSGYDGSLFLWEFDEKGISLPVTINSIFGASSIRDIAYGGNRFVLVGESGTIAYSADGAGWASAPGISIFGRSHINAVIYARERFIAVGNDGKMAYSSDGINWTAVPNNTFNTSGICAIAYGASPGGTGRFVAGGWDGKMAYSHDGIHWTAVPKNTFAESETIHAIAWGVVPDRGEGRWVAVVIGTGWKYRMVYSDDGVQWSAAKSTPPDMDVIFAVAYGNGRWIAGDGLSQIMYSNDGITWNAAANNALDGNAGIFGIYFAENLFIAVTGGNIGKMAYSHDGIIWTRNNAFIGYGSLPIAYGNNRFIAVHQTTYFRDPSRIAYSDDGIRWMDAD
jgi:hypothetical protein